MLLERATLGGLKRSMAEVDAEERQRRASSDQAQEAVREHTHRKTRLSRRIVECS